MMIETRQGRNVEDEYFNATLTVQNRGSSVKKLNATLLLRYSGLIVERKLTIGDWDWDRIGKISIPYLPVPENMNWVGSEVVIDWKGKSFGNIVTQKHKVNIVLKTNNIESSVASQNERSNEDDQNHPPLTPLSIQQPSYQIKPQTHIGDVLDIWEGSSSGSSYYYKGSGPSAKVKIKFNSAVNGFSITYNYIGTSHSSWAATYTQYWSGYFSSGSTWVFTLNFGWTIQDSKYVFGQGNFQFSSVTAYGYSPSYWIDSHYRDGYNDDFNIYVPWYKGIAFRFVMDDGKTTSASGRSHSSIFDDANSRFDNHYGEYDFDIEIYQVFKTYDWTDSQIGWIYGFYFYDYMSLKAGYELRENIKEGFRYLVGVRWIYDSKTNPSNRGYDLIYGISGAYRYSIFDAVGEALGIDLNTGFNFAGKGFYCINPFLCFALYDIGSNLWDNIVQHETSHTFYLDDYDIGSHIMNAELYPDLRSFLLHDSWTNWRTSDQEDLYRNVDKFSNTF